MKSNFFKKNRFLFFVLLPIFVILLTFDLIVKSVISNNFEVGESAEFIPNVLRLCFVKNTGAAWSVFAGEQIFLIIISIVMILVLLCFYFFQKKKGVLLNICMGLLLAGSVGNLVDRIGFGYVRDMLQFDFWQSFPVFNIADVCICLGTALFFVYFLIEIVNDSKLKKVNDE